MTAPAPAKYPGSGSATLVNRYRYHTQIILQKSGGGEGSGSSCKSIWKIYFNYNLFLKTRLKIGYGTGTFLKPKIVKYFCSGHANKLMLTLFVIRFFLEKIACLSKTEISILRTYLQFLPGLVAGGPCRCPSRDA